MKNRILIIEDDEAISKSICMNLSVAGYDTLPLYDGRQVIKTLETSDRFDLALLDIMLPEISGFDLLEPLTKRGIPVIYLTAKNDLESKVRGLQSGAEDYIVKPFEILELLVRIEKVLQRFGKLSDCMQIDDVEINTSERTASKNGRRLALKHLEYELLVLLARNKNIALSREKLIQEIWRSDFMGETRTVDVHIAQLRKKTGLTIEAVPKVGYRLETSS